MSLFGIRNLAPYLLSDMSCSDGLKVYPSSLWVDYMKERNEINEFYTFIEITLSWHKKYTKKKQPKDIIMTISNIVIF